MNHFAGQFLSDLGVFLFIFFIGLAVLGFVYG